MPPKVYTIVFSPYSDHTYILPFWIVIQTGMRWVGTVIFVFSWWSVILSIFPCTCWLFVYVALRNVYFKFLIGAIWGFLLFSCLGYFYIWILTLIRCMRCEYFLPFHLLLYTVDCFLCCAELFTLMQSHLYDFCFCFLFFWDQNLKISLP